MMISESLRSRHVRCCASLSALSSRDCRPGSSSAARSRRGCFPLLHRCLAAVRASGKGRSGALAGRVRRAAALLTVVVATGACAGSPAVPVFEPDPMLHPPGGRIVFNRMCADEEPYRVKAYARMESPDGRAQAVAAVLAGYRATGGKTVFVDVRIQRLKLNAGEHWRNANYTIRLTARTERAMVEDSEVDRYVESAKGEIRFITGEAGTADWITFVEPDDEGENFERFHRFAPELDFTDHELKVSGPRDEFDLTLILRNETNGRTLALAGPRVRIPERIWALEPAAAGTLGLLGMLNPVQEGGLFDVLGHNWKYRKCIEERRAAKRFLGVYTTATRADENSVSVPSPITQTREKGTTREVQ